MSNEKRRKESKGTVKSMQICNQNKRQLEFRKNTENKELEHRAETKYSIALENPAYTEPDLEVRTSTFDLNNDEFTRKI